jgi:hypothetical protein
VHVSRRRMRRDMLRVIDRVSPSPWAIEAVVDGLARQFGREIRLVPWEFEQGPGLVSGVWVPTSIRDYIFYDYTVPVWRKNQIVGHELGHRLMNDTPRVHEWPEAIAHSLGDDVVGYQGRSDYEPPRVLYRILLSWKDVQHAEENRSRAPGSCGASGG